MSNIIAALEKEQLRTDLPKLEIGDTVRVYVKVIEGTRERLQAFEGIVIKLQNGGIRTTFTVRRLSYGIGVERTFPLHSPRIGKIEVVRHGVVRRAKLYYLRERVGKAAKIKERIVKRAAKELQVPSTPEPEVETVVAVAEEPAAEVVETAVASEAAAHEAVEAETVETVEKSAPEAPVAEEAVETPVEEATEAAVEEPKAEAEAEAAEEEKPAQE